MNDTRADQARTDPGDASPRPLTNLDLWNTYKRASLGVPPPEDESPEAKAFREQLEADIKADAAKGYVQQSPPFDFCDE